MTLTISKEFAINAGTAATSGKIMVLHSTATPNAPAKNIASYEHRVWRSAQTFVHFAVDDVTAYQIGTPGYKAWGAGNVNSKAPVQIELCEFSDKTKALNAYKNFITLARMMASKYGIPLTLDDGNKTAGCKSHRWCSRNYGGSDHSDPYQYLPSIGISQAQFAADLKNGVGAVTVKESTTTSAPVSTAKVASGKIAVDGYWGSKTTLALQRLYDMKWQDGVISKPSQLIKILQKHLGVTQDGYMGPITIKAMQRALGTVVDGVISQPSLMVKAMQAKINAGVKPF